MRLYHFTCVEHLPLILADGLNRGEVTFDFNQQPLNGVWFTSLDTSGGQGLGSGRREVTLAERRILGIPDDAPPRFFADKHAVRITTVIPSSDRLLKPWAKWGRKHCPKVFDAMNSLAPHWKQSYIYFGTIAPDRFLEVRAPNSHHAMAA